VIVSRKETIRANTNRHLALSEESDVIQRKVHDACIVCTVVSEKAHLRMKRH